MSEVEKGDDFKYTCNQCNHIFSRYHLMEDHKCGEIGDIDKIKSLEAKLALAIEALEFYANVESWNLIHPSHDRKDAKTIVNMDTSFNDLARRSFGGKLARKALTEIKEMK